MNTTRRRFLKTMALALPAAAAWPARSAEASAPYGFDPSKDIIPAPDDPALWPQYREDLVRWREQIRARLNYNDSLYRQPEFQWSAANYCCGYIMAWDRQFLDPASGHYTVDVFLDEGERKFGGYDSVVLWQAYPRIGADDRNQFDFYRDLPGGLRGLRAVVRRCHRRGVRVYIDYNPWDTGTRREPGSDIDTLVNTVRALEADGIFSTPWKRAAPISAPSWMPRGRASSLKANSPSRSKISRTITPPGRNGSMTAARRACCAPNGSSATTCSTSSGAGTMITRANCIAPG